MERKNSNINILDVLGDDLLEELFIDLTQSLCAVTRLNLHLSPRRGFIKGKILLLIYSPGEWQAIIGWRN
jgi:hypothetical protein